MPVELKFQTIHIKRPEYATLFTPNIECYGLNLHIFFQIKSNNSRICICSDVESTDQHLLLCNTNSRVKIKTILTLPNVHNVELNN